MLHMKRRIALSCMFGLALACFALPASAQNKRGGTPQIILPDTEITGERQRPEAFYILDKQNVGYEKIDTAPSFLDDLVETVEDKQF